MPLFEDLRMSIPTEVFVGDCGPDEVFIKTRLRDVGLASEVPVPNCLTKGESIFDYDSNI